MKCYSKMLCFLLGIGLLVSTHAAQEPSKDHAIDVSIPSELQWNDVPSLPPGAKMAVLQGDPMKPGTFTMRMRFPKNWQVPPHTHPVDENVTVLSGTLHIGHGDRFDKSAAKAFSTGTYYSMPANMVHFGYVDEETVIQVHGQGPWGIKYINPADDPRQGKS